MSDSAEFPVFIQPTDLQFIVAKPETHKQVITLYNPYEFSLRYAVLSNAPTKYRVVEPRGFIRPKCYMDIMVRHLSPTLSAAATNDCLRIEIYREHDSVCCGRKDVPLNVLAVDNNRYIATDQFKAFPPNSGRSTSGSVPPNASSAGRQQTSRHVSFAAGSLNCVSSAAPNTVTIHAANFYWFVIFGLFTCIITLMLPTAMLPPALPHDTPAVVTTGSGVADTQVLTLSSFVPVYLRPSATLQLVAAYVLGILTVYLILPNQ